MYILHFLDVASILHKTTTYPKYFSKYHPPEPKRMTFHVQF